MLKRYTIFVICLTLGTCISLNAYTANKRHVNSAEITYHMNAILSSSTLNTPNLINTLLVKYEDIYTQSSSEYAECLLWCAYACAYKGDNMQAKQLIKKSDDIYKNYGTGVFSGRDTLAQIFHHELNAILEREGNRTYIAARHLTKALKLKKSYFGEDTEIYLISLLNLSQIFADRLQYGKSSTYHTRGHIAYIERLKTEFCSTSEFNRTTYWATASKYINKTLDIAYNFKGFPKGQITSSAYNAILLSKGLLLNTTRNFENHIISSKNPKAIELLETRKAYIEKQVAQKMVDSLDYEILNTLKEAKKEFRLPQLDIKWTDISSHLGKNDLAIEFFKTSNGKYGAILLKKNWKAPKLFKLDEVISINKKRMVLDKAIRQVSLSTYTDSIAENIWNLSKGIWTDDIVKHFPTEKDAKVYFAADGELLILAIENLPFVKTDGVDNFHSVSDLFNIYRLSSTRELAINKNPITNSSAVIYGGLKYNMYYDDMVEDAKKYTRSSKALRYLAGTQIEADSIYSTISRSPSKGFTVTQYGGVEGTEASFKSLSGKDIRLIHIATHGYFYDADDKDLQKLELGGHPLNCNGLLFSGADNKWFGDTLPQGVDDGFLTSLEISALDFHNTELVILSACETGKGRVEGDGVFGLQRGFKMAGINSIIMSLWKVDDDATCRLMIEFYKNWITKGMNKHDALEHAKKTLRSNKDKGWDNPFYWAGFILLDGVQ